MTFLFDIGNVLLRVDFDRAVRRLLPNPPADLDARFARLLVHKDELESGRLAPGPFIDDAIRMLDFRGPRNEFIAAWCDVFDPIKPMWQLVEQLATAGHRLILFSNTNDLHMDDAMVRYEVFRHFPEAVFSHRVGALKPDEPIYRHAIDRHQLDPAGTIYIDDLPANIATGQQLGFRAWQYSAAAHPAFLAWLDRQLA
jgi:putative hydrolase of the HAD superfamily